MRSDTTSELPEPSIYLKRSYHPKLEITDETYNEIVTAREVLRAARRIEEKFHIVAVNYAELEKYLSNQTVEWLIFRPTEIYDLNETIIHINVHISNLLSSVRMYTDQVAHDIKACVEDEQGAMDYVKDSLSIEYDDEKNYRLMEKIRNYTQHRSVPVHKIRFQPYEVERELEQYEHTLKVVTYRDKLLEDRSFNATARTIINEFDEEIDLKYALRCYVSGLSKVHMKVREYLKPACDDSILTVEQCTERYNEIAVGNGNGKLNAFREIDEDVQRTPVSSEMDEVRKKLITINSGMGENPKHYASSAASAPKST